MILIAERLLKRTKENDKHIFNIPELSFLGGPN